MLPLLTLKWHIRTDDHSYTMLFEGGTPLNNPSIEIHTCKFLDVCAQILTPCDNILHILVA